MGIKERACERELQNIEKGVLKKVPEKAQDEFNKFLNLIENDKDFNIVVVKDGEPRMTSNGRQVIFAYHEEEFSVINYGYGYKKGLLEIALRPTSQNGLGVFPTLSFFKFDDKEDPTTKGWLTAEELYNGFKRGKELECNLEFYEALEKTYKEARKFAASTFRKKVSENGWLSMYDDVIGKNYEPPKEKSNLDLMSEALMKQWELGYDKGYEEAERQRKIAENHDWNSPFATIANKLPLVNIEMIEEIEKCMSDIVAENWDYFGELICCYKQEFKGVVGWEFEHGDHLKITVFTLDGYKYFTCDLRCFTDENFLKERSDD